MICFGLGTFPALLFLGYSTHLLSFLKQKAVRICLGLLIVIFGIINIIQYAKSTNHQAHAHQMQMKMQH
jgi:sulfite exporter TauE/SafE